MRTATQKNYRCDHSSTNALDPIRTLQLSVLGREHYLDGGPLGKSSCCTPFIGSYGYHSGLPLIVPKCAALPIAIGAGRLLMSLKVIHFQSIFLIDFYLKRLIYVQKYGITHQTAMQQGIQEKEDFLQ